MATAEEDVQLPIVDLELLKGSAEDRAKFNAELDRGMFGVGFFYLKWVF